MQRFEIKDGWLEFKPDFLTGIESTALFHHFLHQLPLEQGKIKLFGKEHIIPRLESFHSEDGKSYGYSGKRLTTHRFDLQIIDLKNRIEKATGYKFNSVLVNFYRDGKDSNGWHADNEPELGKDPIIASMSLGATRRFELQHSSSGDKHSFELTNGSLLIMGGSIQQFWKHRIPKQLRINEGRINLTFRYID
jgi:alkylated DNA repair dioxygenase AlkB